MFQHMLAYAAEVVEIVCRLVAAGKSKKVTGLAVKMPSGNRFIRMRSKGSLVTLGVYRLRVCSLDVAFATATVRNRVRALCRACYVECCKSGQF